MMFPEAGGRKKRVLKGVWGLSLLLLMAGCSDPSKGLTSSDPQVRAQAIRELSASGADAAARQVASVARHEDDRTASQAILALGRMASPCAAEALKDVVTAERRVALRRLAAVSLTQRPEPLAAEALRRAVKTDTSPEVRAEAALGLARRGTVDDVYLLADAATSEPDSRAAHSEVTAVETLVGLRFPYDPAAPPEVRRECLERMRTFAIRAVEVRKGLRPPDMQCLSDRRQSTGTP
jgi:HEAT repeat protein